MEKPSPRRKKKHSKKRKNKPKGTQKRINDPLQAAPFFLFLSEFIAYAPNGADAPFILAVQLFPNPFHMDIYRSGIPHIFIAPDAIQQLLSGKYPIGMLRQKT